MSTPTSAGAASDVPGTGDRRLLLLLCAAVVVARLATVWMPLRNDEGGYLLVARQWRTGGEFLYGDYFVDRPPLLLRSSGWPPPASGTAGSGSWRSRSPSCSGGRAGGAGRWVGGTRGARWAAAVGAALVCSPALAADQADGELFATGARGGRRRRCPRGLAAPAPARSRGPRPCGAGALPSPHPW